ncbi:MAG: 16S rRNA (cytosine(1402)-N(4))-methyltransferase RsmH [Paludibacteraceae bacterium]|nr:16S rRNA (cytosine(1402)-N(4))-methyltransferase RsmH [Paludibacteraceae bacterium]
MNECTCISNPVYHIPAMLSEVLEGLCIDSGKPQIFIDATFGGGGHSRGIMERMSTGSRLFGIDQDLDAYDNRIDDKRFTFVRSNFRYIANFMDFYGVTQVDGILADLGVSFHHFDSAERGFSFRYDAPLDMRMNARQQLSAAEVINTYSEEELARILYLYGEFGNSRAIARQIVSKRSQQTIQTTQQLQDSVRLKDKQDYARLFQALRIEVNDELGALRELLEASTQLLSPGGRLVILTYHSLEDRIVKNFMRSGNTEGTVHKDFYGKPLTPYKVIEKGRTASAEEVERNPRARSAKLRVAERINEQLARE